MRLIDDITFFLEGEGFVCSHHLLDGLEAIGTHTHDGKHPRTIIPLEISAESPEEACTLSESARICIGTICRNEGYPVIITEDRWNSQKSMTQARLLAHLEIFSQAFARNCEIRRIDKKEAQEFLQANHSYGHAACRYQYGMFLKRQTGHLAEKFPVKPGMTEVSPGMLVAVATFSNARKWIKGDKEIRSYEWTRFASLPGLRISGGMGKMLKTFINEVRPDDIMSYADLEWSEGSVYNALGFSLEGTKDPVMFVVDTDIWERFPIRSGKKGNRYFRNFGSNKYRLKLTDYE